MVNPLTQRRELSSRAVVRSTRCACSTVADAPPRNRIHHAAPYSVTVTSKSNRNHHANPTPWPVALTARRLAIQHDDQVAGEEETRQTRVVFPSIPIRLPSFPVVPLARRACSTAISATTEGSRQIETKPHRHRRLQSTFGVSVTREIGFAKSPCRPQFDSFHCAARHIK